MLKFKITKQITVEHKNEFSDFHVNFKIGDRVKIRTNDDVVYSGCIKKIDDLYITIDDEARIRLCSIFYDDISTFS